MNNGTAAGIGWIIIALVLVVAIVIMRHYERLMREEMERKRKERFARLRQYGPVRLEKFDER